MDLAERILNLDRVKVQLLIPWLSPQELEILESPKGDEEKALPQSLNEKIEYHLDRLERGKGLQR
jgi:hypothetical protein